MQKNKQKKNNNLASEDFILTHIDLVHSVAHKYTTSERYSYEDLFQQGVIGLINAANTFDDSRGVKFGSYAYKLINNSILDFIYSNVSPVSFSSNAGKNYLKAKKEIDSSLDMTLTENGANACPHYRFVSLEAEYDDLLISDIAVDTELEPDEVYIEHETAELIRRAVSSLNVEDENLIRNCFGIDRNKKTLSAIADDYGITRQAVSDRVRVVLNKLKPILATLR